MCQEFMNSAAIKYNKIAGTKNGFKGSIYTIQDDIVALIASKRKPAKHSCEYDNIKPPFDDKKQRFDEPIFNKHFKCGETGERYKVGDSKEFQGDTYYFCDAPTHKNRTKWHKHHPDKCRLRKAWLKEQGEDKSDNKTPPSTANIADREDNDKDDSNEHPNKKITAILASAMNLTTDNEVVKELIAEAINASTE